MTRKTDVREEPKNAILVVSLSEAKELIGKQLETGLEIVSRDIPTKDSLSKAKADRSSWYDYTKELLKRICDSDQLAREFDCVTRVHRFVEWPFQEELKELREHLQSDLDRLDGIHIRIELFVSPKKDTAEGLPGALGNLELLARRFHIVVRQLRSRHDNRVTLEINDEYDVQDLLLALLKIFFGDIRPEEWTPSYAGGSSRMDFLLKAEQTVLEVKKTRQGLRDKQVGDQLLEDIGRYRSHPDCKTLVCFVYDPDGHISNPDGLENDLNKLGEDMKVKVIVAPRGE